MADNQIEDSGLSGEDKALVESLTADIVADALTAGRIPGSPLRALARHVGENCVAVRMSSVEEAGRHRDFALTVHQIMNLAWPQQVPDAPPVFVLPAGLMPPIQTVLPSTLEKLRLVHLAEFVARILNDAGEVAREVARVRFTATFDGEEVVALTDVGAGHIPMGTLTFRITAEEVQQPDGGIRP
ncbi:hypothetical protein [Nocardia sp. IFM 10818]